MILDLANVLARVSSKRLYYHVLSIPVVDFLFSPCENPFNISKEKSIVENTTVSTWIDRLNG